MQLEGTVHDRDVLCLLKRSLTQSCEEPPWCSPLLSLQWSSGCFFIFPAFDSTLLCHHIAWLAMRLTSKHQLRYEIYISPGPQRSPSRPLALHQPSVIWLQWLPGIFILCPTSHILRQCPAFWLALVFKSQTTAGGHFSKIPFQQRLGNVRGFSKVCKSCFSISHGGDMTWVHLSHKKQVAQK